MGLFSDGLFFDMMMVAVKDSWELEKGAKEGSDSLPLFFAHRPWEANGDMVGRKIVRGVFHHASFSLFKASVCNLTRIFVIGRVITCDFITIKFLFYVSSDVWSPCAH